MFNKQEVMEFIKPYYVDKDIMHNMWHIELRLHGNHNAVKYQKR